MTAEQYDVPAFRSHSRKLLKPVVYQIEDALATGYKVLGVLGVEGSPSCGVDWTCRGHQGGSCGAGEHRACKSSGSGVYMNIFRGMLQDRGISLPFVGVEEERPNMKALMNLLS
jgi:predicted secreted protein